MRVLASSAAACRSRDIKRVGCCLTSVVDCEQWPGLVPATARLLLRATLALARQAQQYWSTEHGALPTCLASLRLLMTRHALQGGVTILAQAIQKAPTTHAMAAQ